ncbi:sugar-binding domain-containing protein [Sphingomonas sp.]|uniref:sugar-binding domain-containing protein n=1 Tax=Sphingomonas sp. TaxID=28214 RepID=UPI0025F665FD|nr:sugar-binding domain-containing protein [Sphingomonas sp.]
MDIRRIVCAGIFAVALAVLADPLIAQSRTGLDTGVVAAGRSRTNFNADWRFKLGKSEGAEASAFDDRGWARVGLPHSFSLPYFRSSAFYTGDGWYRKTFTLPALSPGRWLSLEFEGAFQDARVFVNGIELARHRGGYTRRAVRPQRGGGQGQQRMAADDRAARRRARVQRRPLSRRLAGRHRRGPCALDRHARDDARPVGGIGQGHGRNRGAQ